MCATAVAAVMVMATASLAVAEDFSGMRGANYVPSYARNDVQIWMDYDPDVIDRELGYAARLKLNTVRVFLQVAVYERDPKLFLERFENFLVLCDKHHLRMMPVVFDSCFGQFPDLVNYKDKNWMANPGQNRLGQEHWPKMEQYVRDVVGGHKDDRRIVMWDVMNEPTCTSFKKPQDKELIWTFLRHFLDYVKQVDPNHPRTVGVEHSNLIPQVLDRVEVLCTHNYRKNLQEDLRAVKALGRKHGKPVIINEVAGRPQQPYSYVMPILAEEKVGWCFWELMIGRTQFTQGATPYQGVIYPDGTCFDAAEVMHIVHPGQTGLDPKQVAADVGLPQRPRSWSVERAWTWYKARPWIVGINYHPGNVVNTTELWAADTFDEKTIDAELALAAKTGFNACRTNLQYLVWKHDAQGMKNRMERFLTIARKHGIGVMFVPFDDCAFGAPPTTEPYLGKQKDPTPGMIMPNWTPSPGLKAVTDRAAWPDLEKYIKDIVGTFAQDTRVLMWDLYNEPGNSGMGNRSLPLVEATFAWAREVDPSQPLSMGMWDANLHDLNRVMAELSDIITFHAYTDYQRMRSSIAHHKANQRPVICTEWMTRHSGARWETDLPLFRREAVGCFSWGLVNGRMQCQFTWWDKPGTPEPKLWFCDLYRKDMTPYDPKEIELIGRITADKNIDFAARDYSRPQPAPGEISDTDPNMRYSDGWTAWAGSGPRCGTLHYHNAADSRVDVGFEGKTVHLVYKAGPDCGLAQLLIDGKPATKQGGGELEADSSGNAVLDTYGAAVDWNRRVTIARGLAPGKHTLTVIVTGKKNAASSNCHVQIVGVDIES